MVQLIGLEVPAWVFWMIIGGITLFIIINLFDFKKKKGYKKNTEEQSGDKEEAYECEECGEEYDTQEEAEECCTEEDEEGVLTYFSIKTHNFAGIDTDNFTGNECLKAYVKIKEEGYEAVPEISTSNWKVFKKG